LILKVLMHLSRIPIEPGSAILNNKAGRIAITTIAEVIRPIRSREGLSFTLKAIPGEIIQVAVSGVPRPKQVILDGAAIPFVPDLDRAEQGWTWDAELKCLLIKGKQPAAQAAVKVSL